jgi:hypothetical protein
MVEKVVKINVDQVQAQGGLDKFISGIKESDKQTESLRTQLRKAQQDVAELSAKFGATSKEAVEAAKRAGELKDQIGDARALTDAFNPDAKFKALSASLSGVASGFAAYQGALGLVGVENKNLEQQLLKVQSAMALANGLQSLGEARDSFKQLKAVAIDAFNGIKTAIGSTGIGLLVIALGAIYTYWDDIKETVSGVTDEQKALNVATNKNLEAEKQKLSTMGNQDNILKLQGKTEKEILQSKIRQTDEVIKATELSIKNAEITLQSQIEAEIRNKKILTGLLEVVQFVPLQILKLVDLLGEAIGKNFNLASRFKDFATGFIFDPEKTRAEGEAAIKAQRDSLEALKNDRAGFQLAINEIDRKDADDAKAKAEEESRKILESRREYLKKANDQQEEFSKLDDERRAREAQAEEKKKGDALARLTAEANGLNTLNEYKKKALEESIAYELNARQAFEDAKFNIASQGLQLLSQISGKSKALATGILILEKGLAISQVIVSASRSIAQAQANLAATPAVIGVVPNPMYAVQAAATAKGIITTKIAAGISIASILAQTIGKLSGGSVGGGSSSSGGGGGGTSISAPSFNIVGQNTNNQLAQSIAGQQRQPIEAYVVSGNISSAQSLDRNRVNTATFN